MLRPTSPDLHGEAGFTLIEGLVTLAVIAASVGAIAELSDQSRRATLAAVHRTALVTTAERIETGLPSRAQLHDGERSGALDNHRWRLETSSLPGADAPGLATLWRPHRLSLQVQGPNGETWQIETIRLQLQAAP